MEITTVVMYVGFLLAAYSVVGNDVIQTLGTFLSSNEKRPWYVLWAYAATILLIVVGWGWYAYDGRVRLLPSPECASFSRSRSCL